MEAAAGVRYYDTGTNAGKTVPNCPVVVRYADDLLVVCRTRGQAQAALAKLTALLHSLGLEPKPQKTRIVQLVEGEPGFDYLGFQHRLVRSRPRRGTSRTVFLARWPSKQAMQHARDRIRFLTMKARLAAPVEQIVAPRANPPWWANAEHRR